MFLGIACLMDLKTEKRLDARIMDGKGPCVHAKKPEPQYLCFVLYIVSCCFIDIFISFI